jgi:acetyl esterase
VPLDPQAKLVLDNLPSGLFDIHTTTPTELRKLYEDSHELPFPAEPVARVEERRVPGPGGEIPIRVYAPNADTATPPVVFFHGGGWVLCNLDTHDGAARKLANASGCTVVSVDYRLAPENPFPAAAEDCYAAAQWVSDNAEQLGARPGPIAVVGDSAGGNLATVTALMARDGNGPDVAQQVLVYPVIDCDFERPSFLENAEGYLLTRDVMIWFWDQYVPDETGRRDPYVRPLGAELAGLPPALVITAEYDPLRDEGEAYARALKEAGVDVTCTRYDGMIHGFLSFADFVDKAKEAMGQAGAVLRGALKP